MLIVLISKNCRKFCFKNSVLADEQYDIAITDKSCNRRNDNKQGS